MLSHVGVNVSEAGSPLASRAYLAVKLVRSPPPLAGCGPSRPGACPDEVRFGYGLAESSQVWTTRSRDPVLVIAVWTPQGMADVSISGIQLVALGAGHPTARGAESTRRHSP